MKSDHVATILILSIFIKFNSKSEEQNVLCGQSQIQSKMYIF